MARAVGVPVLITSTVGLAEVSFTADKVGATVASVSFPSGEATGDCVADVTDGARVSFNDATVGVEVLKATSETVGPDVVFNATGDAVGEPS